MKTASPPAPMLPKRALVAGSPTDISPPVKPFPRVAEGKFKPVFAEPNLTPDERGLAERFHDMYYSKLDCGRGLHTIVLSWLGYEMFKCPMDLWTYQELIVSQKPDVIIETGTYKGGSALYLASVCDLVGHGEIVTVDLDGTHQPIRPRHPRITYFQGSSTAPEIVARVSERVAGRTNVLVILDSDHKCEHVLAELRIYRQFVPVGGFLIVEDTNINGHPTYKDFGPGPWEAVDQFLVEDRRFVADRTCERFILTMNPRGYLRRIR
ncbi:MAG TPA: CmcI family methyltransferase [Verrucomicrobiae bacterium]|nr:CmcI family methyltransferase [Verrucomicrobiae bacterium]